MNRATYSPEDNKIRVYLDERLNKKDWDTFKKAGFFWTMKQESDLVATWNPSREDLVLKFCETIEEHESDSMFDRSADRAERFSNYRDKREGEAYDSLTTSEAVGMQSQEKAERKARKIERLQNKSSLAWHKAEYWTKRVSAVINHAIYKDRSDVRQRRIKEIEKNIRREEKEEKQGDYSRRYLEHNRMRLNYEKAILKAQIGETLEDMKLEKGGMIKGCVIHGINKSPATKKNNSFKVLGTKWDGKTPALVSIKIGILTPEDYEAPTPASLERLKIEQEQLKAITPTKPKLLNPTIEEAKKLQAVLNSSSKVDAKAFGAVKLMTMEEYKKASSKKLSYSPKGSTSNFTSYYKIASSKYTSEDITAFKVRTYRNESLMSPPHVVVITDKKQHTLPQIEVEDMKGVCNV